MLNKGFVGWNIHSTDKEVRMRDVIMSLVIYGSLEEALNARLGYIAQSLSRSDDPGPFHREYLDLLSVKFYYERLTDYYERLTGR